MQPPSTSIGPGIAHVRSSAKQLNNAGDMPSHEKKKTRGAKKVRKAGKKQRREKISKSGKPKA